MALYSNKAFLNHLEENKILDHEKLRICYRDATQKGERLDHHILKKRLLAEDLLLTQLSNFCQLPYLHLSDKNIDQKVINQVPAKIAHHYRILPVEYINDKLSIATNNPFNLSLIDEIRLALDQPITTVLCSQREINDALKKYYGIGAETMERMMDQSDPSSIQQSPIIELEEITDDAASEASIIKFVNQILFEAYKDRATDIHIEPFEDELRIRYRIDGILHRASVPASVRHFHSSIISRIKIMANLDIAERRLPQDGRIKVKIGEDELDLRVSVIPTPYGESIDIRLLSGGLAFLELERLGLQDSELQIMDKAIKKPHGIIFVTGPTGSGKTTTLYACLSRLNNEEKKILTIEDPVEYLMHGISQMQVNTKIDFSFSRALRSMLRHDPDIMMVGEVRDYETAEITIRVALTGHLVFSTLHTNDAPSAITRLIDIGIEPYLVSSSVECLIAQRLVRRICNNCKSKIDYTIDDLRPFQIEKIEPGLEIFDGNGCEKCKFTGYLGRTAIYEILMLDDDIREAIVEKKPAHEIKAIAISNGMKTLRQNGWRKIKLGLTSIGEVIRVTQDEPTDIKD